MKSSTVVVAACALAALGPSAFAQAYVGIGLGSTHACLAGGVAGTCPDNGTTFKALAGYTFPGTDFAVEGIYTHLGPFKANSAVGSADVEVDTVGVGGAWRHQFGAGWGGMVRGGIAYGRSKTDFTTVEFATLPTIVTGSYSYDYWQPYLGAGATYAITPRVRLEAGVDFTRIKTGHGAPTDATGFLFGATFGF